jgi:hypothetical protein
MRLIQSLTVSGSSTASFDFNSIPQTFTHLQARVSIRLQASQSTPYDLTIVVNGATPANQFAFHRLSGDGSSPSSANYINDNLFRVPLCGPNAYHTANVFGAAVIDILDYTSTSKGKTLKALGGYDNGGSGANPYAGWINLTSSVWHGATTAINSLSFASFGNFSIGSKIDLYGITSSPTTGV